MESFCNHVSVQTSVHLYMYVQVNVKNDQCHIYYQHALLTPLANSHSIVGLQLPTLDVTCYVLSPTLLHVVACCWKLLHPFAHHRQHARKHG